MSKCGEGSIEVLHMTPCNDVGWRALFFQSANPHQQQAPESWTTPIVAWIWVQHGDEEHAHPLVALAGDVCDATTVANYIGVIAPGDMEGEKVMLEAAQGEIRQALSKTA